MTGLTGSLVGLAMYVLAIAVYFDRGPWRAIGGYVIGMRVVRLLAAAPALGRAVLARR